MRHRGYVEDQLLLSVPSLVCPAHKSLPLSSTSVLLLLLRDPPLLLLRLLGDPALLIDTGRLPSLRGLVLLELVATAQLLQQRRRLLLLLYLYTGLQRQQT